MHLQFRLPLPRVRQREAKLGRKIPFFYSSSFPWNLVNSVLLAVSLKSGRGANLVNGNELVSDDRLLNLLRRHPGGRQKQRRHFLAGRCVLGDSVGQRLRSLETGPSVHGEGNCTLSLQRNWLVHGAALVARNDVLETGGRRVLARGRERERLHAVRLQISDDWSGALVVRVQHGVRSRVSR